MKDRPPRDSSLPPGYDEEDPYDDEDISTYPRWWRESIDEFRAHEMRPYRPPRFTDGELTPILIERLESELGAEIQFRSINPQDGNDWELMVEGTVIESVERTREGDGFSLYHLTSDCFESLVRSAVTK